VSALMVNGRPSALHIGRSLQLEESVGDLQHEDVGMVVLVTD